MRGRRLGGRRDKRRIVVARHIVNLLALLAFLSVTLPTAAAQWYTVESDHFFVHFTAGNDSLATAVARRAEAAHTVLVPRIGHSPATKTHIVIRRDTDLANGYASPVFENHIVIYTAFPTLAHAYLSGFDFKFDDWLMLLLEHEYTHTLHVDMQSPAVQVLTDVLGRVPLLSTPMALVPPFYTEGFAVYQESGLSAGRGQSAYFDMFLRTHALADTLPPSDQVLGFYPLTSYMPGGGPYLFGYSFLDYIARRIGPDALHRLNEHLTRRPDSLANAIEAVTEHDMNTLWSDWQSQTKELARPAFGERLTPTAIVPTTGYHALYATPHPVEPHTVAFVATGGIVPEVRLADIRTGTERSLASVQAAYTTSIAWHPTGDHLIVSAIRRVADDLVRFQLARIDAYTGRTRWIADTWGAISPTYAPDGQRLAYVVNNGEKSELWVHHVTNGTRRPVFANEHTVLLSAAWAPNDDVIALTAWHPMRGAHIATYDLNSNRYTVVVSGDASYQTPSWTDSGQSLLLTSDQDGIFNVYRYDVPTGKLYALTTTATGLFQPQSTANGQLLATEYTAHGYRVAQVLDVNPVLVVPTPKTRTPRQLQPVSVSEPRPYSAWPTLAPNFFLPAVKQIGDESYIGLFTAGADVLGNSTYSVDVGLGLASGRMVYTLNVSHTPWDNQPLTLYGAAGRAPLPDAALAWSGLLGGRWDVSSVNGGQSLWLQARRIGRGVDAAPVHLLEIGWDYVSVSGSLGQRWERRGRWQGLAHLNEGDKWLLQYEHGAAYRTGHDAGVDVGFHVAVAGDAQVLGYGSAAPVLSLRGFARQKWAGESDVLVRGHVAGRVPVATVERGWRDAPLFLKSVALYPFSEVGYAVDRSTRASVQKFALGVELSVDTYVGWGAARLDWRFGVAQGLGEPGPQLYVRAASSF